MESEYLQGVGLKLVRGRRLLVFVLFPLYCLDFFTLHVLLLKNNKNKKKNCKNGKQISETRLLRRSESSLFKIVLNF